VRPSLPDEAACPVKAIEITAAVGILTRDSGGTVTA
jgi:hypothetical protein